MKDKFPHIKNKSESTQKFEADKMWHVNEGIFVEIRKLLRAARDYVVASSFLSWKYVWLN